MFNFIRALCALFLFALLTACAANGNSERAKDAPVLVVVAGAMLLALDERKGNNDGGGNSADSPTPPPQMTMTTAVPHIAALHYAGNDTSGLGLAEYILVASVSDTTQNRNFFGQTVTLQRMMVTTIINRGLTLPSLNLTSFHADGNIAPVVQDGVTSFLRPGSFLFAFQGRPSITAAAQLCQITWLVPFLRERNFNSCPAMSGLSYTPDIGRVVVAAMSDGFGRGVIVGDSALSFSGRLDGDNRAAGFAYDFGKFQMRTDYIRLPSKQDGEVWLDTYRLGVLRQINDEARFFAGVDSYDNAIFAIDTKGDISHRFGAAFGDGYAVQYEMRLNL